MKKSLIFLKFAAALGAGATLAAHAANAYFVVVPVKGAKAPEGLAVSLSTYQLPQAMVGTPYVGVDFTSMLVITGDSSYNGYGVRWSVDGTLPAGLTLSSNGRLVGTPTAAGNATVRVRATYKTKSGEQAYQFVVVGIGVSLAKATLPDAQVGRPYAYALAPLLSVSGDRSYAGSGVTWTVVSSTLPPGLYLSESGSIVGTPGAPGTGTVTARATYRGINGEQTYQVVTLGIDVKLAAGTAPQAIIGQAYSYDLKNLLTVSGDNAYDGSGVTWTVVSSTLPDGLELKANGTIAGTPTAAGTGAVAVRASYRGVNGEQTYQVVSLDIKVVFDPITMAPAQLGNYYYVDLSGAVTVTGDVGSSPAQKIWSVASGSLPTGISLTATGVVQGMPTKSETKSATLRVTYRGVSAEQTVAVIARSPEDDVLNALDSGTGDGNGDGILDSDQENVHSLRTVVAGNPYVTLEVAQGYKLANVVANSVPSAVPRGVKLPIGILNFRVNGFAPGGTIEVSLYAPSSLAVNAYYALSASGSWANIARSVLTFGTKSKVSFLLTDGGPYDRDQTVNGVIEF